jgi:NitT/TauT family transport system substrate-binding protein
MNIIAGFAGALAVASVTAGSAAAETVRIAFPADSVDFSPAYVAEKIGLFKKANVDVKLTVFRGGAAVQEAMSAGAADLMSYFGPAVALAVSKGAKEKFVMTVLPGAAGWNCIVKTDSPIKTVKDLDGKKIGVSSRASTSDMSALWMAERAGIHVQLVPLGAGLAPGLRSGQVDALVFSALTTQREILSGHARLLLDVGKEMPPTMANGYVATQEMMEKHPVELRATLAALLEASAYMRANKQWTLDFLKGFAKSDDSALIEVLYKQLVDNISRDGNIDAKWIETGLKFAAKAWDQPELDNMNVETLYTNEFLPKNSLQKPSDK